jgi:hypothetical protein
MLLKGLTWNCFASASSDKPTRCYRVSRGFLNLQIGLASPHGSIHAFPRLGNAAAYGVRAKIAHFGLANVLDWKSDGMQPEPRSVVFTVFQASWPLNPSAVYG